MNKFGNIIKNKRLEMNLSLRDLGKLSGLDYSYIGRLENGNSIPSKKTIIKLAKSLNLSKDELLIEIGYCTFDKYNDYKFKEWETVIKKARSNKLSPLLVEKMIDAYIEISKYAKKFNDVSNEALKEEFIQKYDPNYGDNKLCECGHPYYRHFDSYENMEPIGCKYCECLEFKEKEY